MTTNMETRVLIGFLLACTVAGFPVEEAIMDDKIFTPEDYALLENTTAYVYDDNENLVRVTFDKNVYDEDLIQKKDLGNYVFFFLHTKKNPEPKPLYINDDDVLTDSDFDFAKPTRFIIHGWMNSRDSKACTLIRDAYIKHDDYNIIVVDWSKITKKPYYVWASKYVKAVGEFVSTMIDFLHERGMDLSQTTLIGHSLGAHVVGLAGRNAKGEIETVIGLDPALPGFRLAGPEDRISADNAKYVEIIHTNGGLLGFLKDIGDADFYPNGGQVQAGCLVDPGGACSHARAYEFFAESITSQVGFHGRNCDDFHRFKKGFCNSLHASIMGGHKRRFHAHGKYYLTTKAIFPFAKGPSGK